MNYKIICDSCCDITSEMYADPHFSFIPLTLYVGDNIIVDDETFDQASFLKLVDETETASRSACPSAGEYMESYENSDADMIFVVTLSKELSGSYNAARLGKNALCICTVSDSFINPEENTTAEERQNSFTKMMEIALEIA